MKRLDWNDQRAVIRMARGLLEFANGYVDLSPEAKEQIQDLLQKNSDPQKAVALSDLLMDWVIEENRMDSIH